MTLFIKPYIQVTADYRLTDELGDVLDQSPDSEPLRYLHGTGQLLPGLEAAMEGCQISDQVTVTLMPDQAFGEHRSELVFEAVRDNLPEGVELRPGITLTPGGQQGRFSLRVVSLTEKGAMLDGNHPYAGKTLTWELKITHLEDRKPHVDTGIDHTPIKWVERND